jgi:hypothetical protein
MVSMARGPLSVSTGVPATKQVWHAFARHVWGDTHCELLLQVVGQVVAPSQRKVPHVFVLVLAGTAVQAPGVALHTSQPSAQDALQQ